MSTNLASFSARARSEHSGDYRHWSPESQVYATADIVQQMIEQGWQLGDVATAETFYLGQVRHVDVYNFTLYSAGESQQIPVVNGPLVLRLIQKYNISVHRIENRPQ